MHRYRFFNTSPHGPFLGTRQDDSSHSHGWASSQLQFLLEAAAHTRQALGTALALTASSSRTLNASPPQLRSTPPRPGQQRPAGRALLAEAAQDLRRTAWKPAGRAVLASVLGLTTEPPLIQNQNENSCKTGLSKKTKTKTRKRVWKCSLLNQQNWINEQHLT